MECRQDLLLIQARNKRIESDLFAELNAEVIDVESNSGVVYTTDDCVDDADVLENRDDVDSHGKDSIYSSDMVYSFKSVEEDCE